MVKRTRKGATLTELVVVLAVLATISTIVISFVMVSNENVRSSREKAEALGDVDVVESLVESWVEKQISNGYVISITDNYLSSKQLENPKSTLKFNDGVLSSVEDNISYTSSTVSDIDFSVESDNFVICKITYEINISNGAVKHYTYVFTVYPYEFIGSTVENN